MQEIVAKMIAVDVFTNAELCRREIKHFSMLIIIKRAPILFCKVFAIYSRISDSLLVRSAT